MSRAAVSRLPVRLAFLTRAVAVVTLASALTHGVPARLRALHAVLPPTVTQLAQAATILGGLLLLLLANGLRRRKRLAWRWTVPLLVVISGLHVVKGLDVEEAALGLALALGLLACRGEFRAEPDPRSRWVALRTGMVMFLASILLGLIFVEVHDRAAAVTPSWKGELQQVLLGLVGVSGPVRFARDSDADVVAFGLAGLGGFTLLVTLYLALRPAQPEPRLGPDDDRRLRELLARYGGCDSLSYFNLRRDKSVVWSGTGKAAVAYRVVAGVALVSGNPIGDPEAWPGAVQAMLEVATRHAWVPAVLGCGHRAGQVWARAGLEVLEIGDEAVVETETFCLEGRAMRPVRQAVSRVERAGYSCEIRHTAALSDAEVQALRASLQAWRGTATERGFSMALGRFADPDDPDCLVVTASRDGQHKAVLHFVPWGRDGLSLDIMLRDRETPNGVNEFLIATLLQRGPSLGIRRVSLNFAVFRQALESGERLGAGPVSRICYRLLILGSRWFQIDSLYRFNAKFRPIWEPRYLCYPSAADLPRVALATLEAEAFLIWPTERFQIRKHNRQQSRLPVGDRLTGSAPTLGG
jgi:lysyl-tRNA synthetase class 2